jgi:hypothetical protein
MDEAWAWALYFAIAALIFTGISGVAPAIIDRSPKRGWWSIILAVLPLVIWDLLWVQMSNPPDNVRRIASILIGSIAGGAILFAATEMMKRPANAQSSPAERPTRHRSGSTIKGQDSSLMPPAGRSTSIRRYHSSPSNNRPMMILIRFIKLQFLWGMYTEGDASLMIPQSMNLLK